MVGGNGWSDEEEISTTGSTSRNNRKSKTLGMKRQFSQDYYALFFGRRTVDPGKEMPWWTRGRVLMDGEWGPGQYRWFLGTLVVAWFHGESRHSGIVKTDSSRIDQRSEDVAVPRSTTEEIDRTRRAGEARRACQDTRGPRETSNDHGS